MAYCTKKNHLSDVVQNITMSPLKRKMHQQRLLHFLCLIFIAQPVIQLIVFVQYADVISEVMLLTPDTTDCSVLTHSRNPKTPQIRSFFYKKWLLFGVLAGQLDKNPLSSKLAPDFMSI